MRFQAPLRVNLGVLALLLSLGGLACGSTGSSGGGSANGGGNAAGGGSVVGGGGGSAGGGAESDAGVDAGAPLLPRCSATPNTVLCQDESIQQLKLFQIVNDAGFQGEGLVGTTFKTMIDTAAGGLTPNTSYQYAKFTENGLVKVPLSDEAAFGSMDWDFAARRYVVRLNSGISGPSCVVAARLPPGTNFETLERVPGPPPLEDGGVAEGGLIWRTEEYFTPPNCEYVADTSGIGAPATALSSFWTYQQCVQMTGNVFAIQLRDGRYVKLVVDSYYRPDQQTTCNMTGSVPMPSVSGQLRIRWGYIGAPVAP